MARGISPWIRTNELGALQVKMLVSTLLFLPVTQGAMYLYSNGDLEKAFDETYETFQDSFMHGFKQITSAMRAAGYKDTGWVNLNHDHLQTADDDVSIRVNGKYIRYYRADSRFAPSQWETVLLCNDVSHWLGACPKSTLYSVLKQ